MDAHRNPISQEDETVVVPEHNKQDEDISITSRGPGKSSPSLDSFQARRDEKPGTGVSLGVSVHAGFPNPAADKRLRSLDFNQLLVRHPSSTFMFRIRGGQGEGSGIFDGDVAIVDRAPSPRPTDFVLWHDGRSFNLSRPARVAPDATTWGVVTAIIHLYHPHGAGK